MLETGAAEPPPNNLVDEPVPGPTVAFVPPTFTWQALDGQGWPASQDQEHQFVADMRRAASDTTTEATRTATTCVLNALRSGATLEQVRDLLPGMNPSEMLASYRVLSRRLNVSKNAWARIVEHGTQDALNKEAPRAGTLMPIPVHRLQFVLSQINMPERAADLIADTGRRVREVSAQSQVIEEKLTQFPAGHRSAIGLGRSLHDVSQPGLWGHPFFLPDRVGQLSPIRAIDLRRDPR